MSFLAFPDEDSTEEDLTEEQVFQAVITANSTEFRLEATKVWCPMCQGGPMAVGHRLLRRNPHLYAKITRKCHSGHTTTVVYQIDWVAG